MLIDLLNSSNYIMINRDAIRVFGLNTAVYCSELSNIYKKAVEKKKLYDGQYFKVDRNYIEKQTSIPVEEQLKCDLNLVKVNVIKISENDPDIIYIDIEVYASILSSEDVKLLDTVSAKVKAKNVKGSKASQRERIIVNLKSSIECKTVPVLVALRDWIDSVMSDPKKYLSVQQVSLFKEKLDEYCNGDLQMALKLIEIATIHQYVDCQWAINAYEKDKQIQSSIQKSNAAIRKTSQIQTTALAEEAF